MLKNYKVCKKILLNRAARYSFLQTLQYAIERMVTTHDVLWQEKVSKIFEKTTSLVFLYRNSDLTCSVFSTGEKYTLVFSLFPQQAEAKGSKCQEVQGGQVSSSSS